MHAYNQTHTFASNALTSKKQKGATRENARAISLPRFVREWTLRRLRQNRALEARATPLRLHLLRRVARDLTHPPAAPPQRRRANRAPKWRIYVRPAVKRNPMEQVARRTAAATTTATSAAAAIPTQCSQRRRRCKAPTSTVQAERSLQNEVCSQGHRGMLCFIAAQRRGRPLSLSSSLFSFPPAVWIAVNLRGSRNASA